MKRFRYIIVLAWVTGIVSACTDLDTKMNNQWSVDDTWTNAEKAQGVLLSVYQDVLTAPDAWDGNFLDAATDNAMTRVYDSSVFIVPDRAALAARTILWKIGMLVMTSCNASTLSSIMGLRMRYITVFPVMKLTRLTKNVCVEKLFSLEHGAVSIC